LFDASFIPRLLPRFAPHVGFFAGNLCFFVRCPLFLVYCSSGPLLPPPLQSFSRSLLTPPSIPWEDNYRAPNHSSFSFCSPAPPSPNSAFSGWVSYFEEALTFFYPNPPLFFDDPIPGILTLLFHQMEATLKPPRISPESFLFPNGDLTTPLGFSFFGRVDPSLFQKFPPRIRSTTPSFFFSLNLLYLRRLPPLQPA